MPDRSKCRIVVAALVLLTCLPAHVQLKQLPGGGRDARAVMLLVDLSESIEDADVNRIYTPTLRSVVDSLQPGDRFVLAEISARPLGSFAPALDLIAQRRATQIPAGRRRADQREDLRACGACV